MFLMTHTFVDTLTRYPHDNTAFFVTASAIGARVFYSYCFISENNSDPIGPPADSELIAAVLGELIDHKFIMVTDPKTGATRTKESTIKLDDIIKFPRQRALLFIT
jgi:hypothetical protein